MVSLDLFRNRRVKGGVEDRQVREREGIGSIVLLYLILPSAQRMLLFFLFFSSTSILHLLESHISYTKAIICICIIICRETKLHIRLASISSTSVYTASYSSAGYWYIFCIFYIFFIYHRDRKENSYISSSRFSILLHISNLSTGTPSIHHHIHYSNLTSTSQRIYIHLHRHIQNI